MNSPLRPPSDDPLYALPEAARPHYATGMLLDIGDVDLSPLNDDQSLFREFMQDA